MAAVGLTEAGRTAATDAGEMDTTIRIQLHMYINEVRLEVTIPDTQSYHMVCLCRFWLHDVMVGNFKMKLPTNAHYMAAVRPTSP